MSELTKNQMREMLANFHALHVPPAPSAPPSPEPQGACERSRLATCSAVGGEFYSGIEWLAAWLVDHAEGETVTEELARQWAIDAWKEHVRRQGQDNVLASTDLMTTRKP